MLIKKFFAFIISLTVITVAYGQMSRFHDEPDKFMKDLEQFMINAKLEANVKTIEAMQKMVKDGKLTNTWLEKVAKTCNVMANTSMEPYPHFYNYLNAVMNAAKAGKTDIQFSEWNKIILEIIASSRSPFSWIGNRQHKSLFLH